MWVNLISTRCARRQDSMAVLITGTSSGIGLAIARKFIAESYRVIGIDKQASVINDTSLYSHIQWDITDYDNTPNIDDPIEILINNAATQCDNDIEVNLTATIKLTEKYGIQPNIKSIVNMASTSAHNGSEFPEYAASKGGLLAYTKNVALRIAEYGATCNSLSPGGVTTPLNDHILQDNELWNAVMAETLLKRWASAEEIAEWAYFVAVVNKSMTGQDIIIDNGELTKFNFIW